MNKPMSPSDQLARRIEEALQEYRAARATDSLIVGNDIVGDYWCQFFFQRKESCHQ